MQGPDGLDGRSEKVVQSLMQVRLTDYDCHIKLIIFVESYMFVSVSKFPFSMRISLEFYYPAVNQSNPMRRVMAASSTRGSG